MRSVERSEGYPKITFFKPDQIVDLYSIPERDGTPSSNASTPTASSQCVPDARSALRSCWYIHTSRSFTAPYSLSGNVDSGKSTTLGVLTRGMRSSKLYISSEFTLIQVFWMMEEVGRE